jgi:hypothetical protein
MFTGRALALYGRGLLVDLTEAYYLDEDEDGSGFHQDGVRACSCERYRPPTRPRRLTWVVSAVMADIDSVARRSYLLAEWLIELRKSIRGRRTLRTWQEIVDALVVAGVSHLAPYSE